MELSPAHIRDRLDLIDALGWESAVGRTLLADVRAQVVAPVVRRSGLRGGAAAQAEASGWEAAWDALRRPSARTAENPGGMVWAAVRRAVWAEVSGRPASAQPSVQCRTGCPTGQHWPEPEPPGSTRDRTRPVSLDVCLESGWQPSQQTGPTPAEEVGPILASIAGALAAVGWPHELAREVVVLLAESAHTQSEGIGVARWRWVAMRLDLPEWQVRRVASLLLGGEGVPGVTELLVRHGQQVLADASVRAAVRSTTIRWASAPTAHLVGWSPLAQSAVDRSLRPVRAGREHPLRRSA